MFLFLASDLPVSKVTGTLSKVLQYHFFKKVIKK